MYIARGFPLKRVVLPVFAVLAAAAVSVVLYAVARGTLGAGSPAPAPRPTPAAVAVIPVDYTTSVSAADLRAVGLSPVKAGTGIVDFDLEDLKGNKVKLSGLKGSVVFLNFWATWCPPCRAEMPSMERLHARLKDSGLVVLGVDLQEGKGEVEAFVREHKLTFPILLDRRGSAGAAYGVRSIPTTFVIGRDGTILAGRIGGQEWDDPKVIALLERILGR
jgi:peroxiredoxin